MGPGLGGGTSRSPRSIEPSKAASRDVLSASSSRDMPMRCRAASTARPISCASMRDLYHVPGGADRLVQVRPSLLPLTAPRYPRQALSALWAPRPVSCPRTVDEGPDRCFLEADGHLHPSRRMH